MVYKIHPDPVEGQVYTSNNYGDYRILKFINSREVEIEFIETGFKTSVSTGSIRNGAVMDYLLPRKFGHFIGIGPYNEWNSPIVCTRWKGVNQRVYDSGGVLTMSDDWKNFQLFYSWSKDRIGHNNGDYELDKDLLVPGNTHYSPETSCYLPCKINSLKFNRYIKEDGLPMGVSVCKLTGKYRVRWRDQQGVANEIRVQILSEAVQLVADIKKKTINAVAEEYRGVIDERAYQALINWNFEDRLLDRASTIR